MSAIVDGNVVRRPAGPWTPAVHSLLRHFERVGFVGAPRVLSVESGQEVLTYVEGEESDDTSDGAVRLVGAFVRRMHDAQAGFEPAEDAVWQSYPGAVRGEDEVICHNDLFRTNVLFRNGEPAALIDWELAAPGPRAVDLAAPASHLVPLRADSEPATGGPTTERRRERLRILLDGYGLEMGVGEFLDLAIDVRRSWYEAYRVWGGIERHERWAQAYDAGRCDFLAANVDWLVEHRNELA